MNKFDMMCIINNKLEKNQGIYSDEFIRSKNVTKDIHRTKTLEVRCQYCRNFTYIDNLLSTSHMKDREMVCEDCFRFSKLWKNNLNSFFHLKYIHGDNLCNPHI